MKSEGGKERRKNDFISLTERAIGSGPCGHDAGLRELVGVSAGGMVVLTARVARARVLGGERAGSVSTAGVGAVGGGMAGHQGEGDQDETHCYILGTYVRSK
jgi:hypothetical protein